MTNTPYRLMPLAAFLSLSLSCAPRLEPPKASTPLPSPAFGTFEGCAVFLDLADGNRVTVNPAQCAEERAPLSTFKIFGTLVALETAVLTGPDHLLKWDGTKRDIADWNKDQTLESAIKVSAVWYFQEVARRIGAERMQSYVDRVGYGNGDLSGGIDRFWLGSSLKITADEQVDFLARLYRDELPFRPEVMETTRTLLVLEEGSGRTFSGKTGSARELGWFVGHLRTSDREAVFALRIAGPGASGRGAKAIAHEWLEGL